MTLEARIETLEKEVAALKARISEQQENKTTEIKPGAVVNLNFREGVDKSALYPGTIYTQRTEKSTPQFPFRTDAAE